MSRVEAQSFDRIATGYDRLGELSGIELSGPWLDGLLPAAGSRALDLGCGAGRHAVLLAARFGHVDGTGRYDFILSVLTLHHVPDLHAALSHVRTLLAPGGRAVLVDIYPPESAQPALRRMLHRVVPLRSRLHGLAVLNFSTDLVRRGPATAWEIYRLSTCPEWLDHRVTDRFFRREELERSSQALFPGCRLDILGGPSTIGLIWDAPGHSGITSRPADRRRSPGRSRE